MSRPVEQKQKNKFSKSPLKTLKRFLKDRSGSLSIYSAFVLPIMFAGLGGGVVDMVRQSNVQDRLQAATESAVLAAASLDNSLSTADIIDDYIRANFADSELIDDIQINITETERSVSSRDVTIEAYVDVPTSFVSLFGIESLRASAVSSAAQSVSKIEISLVLDVSSSMAGSRIVSLQQAAKEFIDEVTENGTDPNISFNLIPYGGHVNIKAIYDNFAVQVGAPGTTEDPTTGEYTSGGNLPERLYTFSDPDFRSNCIEVRSGDRVGELLPPNSRGQMPIFSRWVVANKWCPPDDSAAIFNSNDVQLLKDRIDDFALSDGTGTDIGTMWGLNALSPAWRGHLGGDFPDRPANYDDDTTLKIAVVMTDGGITFQNRPRDPYAHTGSNRINSSSERQTIYNTGNVNNTSTANTASGYFRRSCEAMHDNGVIVYTIGFQLRNQNTARLLSECASVEANHFLIDDLDISKAFDQIRSSVFNLRVTG